MQVIGLNFTKILAEKSGSFRKSSINTNIEFTELEKTEFDILKDSEALKISFRYSITFSTSEHKEAEDGKILFEGAITLAVSKEEAKSLKKSWKKKQLPNNIRIPLFNLILRKCTPKAMYLADEIDLPSPVPLPKIKPKTEQE